MSRVAHLKSILRSSDSPKRNASVNFNASVKIIGATNSVPLLAGHETDESLTFEYNPPVAAPPPVEEEPVKGGRGGTMRLKGAGVKDFLSMYSAPAVEEKKKVFEREPCILSGYLKLLKESGMKSTWTKRYFTLKKEEISFFRSAESDKALKTIPLSKNVYVKEISAKTGVADCRNALEISYDRKSSLVLQAASRREATEWITAICAIVDALTKGDDDESFEFYDDEEDDFVDTSAPTTPVHTSTSTPISTYTAPVTSTPAIVPTPTPIAVTTSTITVATTTTTTTTSSTGNSSSTRVPVPVVTMTAEELLIIDTNAHATSHDDEFDWVDEDEHDSASAIPVVDDTAAAREREAAAAKERELAAQKQKELELQRQREAEEARQKAEKEREAAAAKERELAAQKQKEANAAKQKAATTTTTSRPTYSTAAKPAATSATTTTTTGTAAKSTFSRAPSAVGTTAARPATNYGRPPTISAPARSFTVPKKLEAHAGLPKSAEAPAASSGAGAAPARESRVSNLLKMWENR